MPEMVSQELVVYLISRQREVRCRLWYRVTPFRDGLYQYSFVWTEELEQPDLS